jgi:iron complex outermembrane receptor protein
MRKLLIFFLLIFSCSGLFSKNVIHGKITDMENLPLPGATIFLPDINKGTIADKDGIYTVTDIPDGKLKIQFSFIGFENKIETVITTGTPIELNVNLRSTIVKTDEIVISAGYSSTQHENAVKIESLKLDFLDIKTTPNFTEVLTSIPGVNMISKGSGVSKPVIRGLSMNDILVLNNGVRWENYQYSDHHPLGIDEAGIEDVEVIKGPASLLYGSDAIGGVINFIKEKPAPIGNISGDYSMKLFSNSLGINNNFGLKGSSKHFFGGIRIGQQSNADYLQGGGTFVPNTRFNEYSIKLNTGYTGKTGSFKLFYDYIRQNLGLAEHEAIDAITSRGRKTDIFFQRFNTHLLSSQNKIYLGKFKLDLNSAFQSTGLTHFAEQDVREIQMRLNTLTYESKLYLPSDRTSEYIIGFQGMNQKNINLHNRETILLPDAAVNNLSSFFLLQKTLFSKLKLQSGLRFDAKNIRTESVGFPGELGYRGSLNRNYSSLSGSFGATYNMTERLLFRSNLAFGFRTPNMAELTSNGQHEARYEIGDPNLHPENSMEFDLSMHYHKQNFTFDLAGFYNRIDNYIFISPTGDTTATGLHIYRYLQSNSSLIGAEAGVHYHPESMKWLHILSTFSTVSGKQENGNYLPFIPAKKLYFELRTEKEKIGSLRKSFITFSLTSVFSQNNPAPEETPTAGYTLFDISTGSNLKLKSQEISIELSVMNIFDKKYVDHLSTLKEVGYFDPGRNFVLAVRIPFGLRSQQ